MLGLRETGLQRQEQELQKPSLRPFNRDFRILLLAMIFFRSATPATRF
jgi:hypothetical protein